MITTENGGGPADRVIIVTGAARGQGRSEVNELARRGAIVVATDIETPSWMQSDDWGPGQIIGRRLDVTDPDSWKRLTDELREMAPAGVRGLVNNAGIPWRAPLLEVAIEDWQRVQKVNVVGGLLGIQAVVPLIVAGSAIVNIGSTAAWSGHFPAAYTVSKLGRSWSDVRCRDGAGTTRDKGECCPPWIH